MASLKEGEWSCYRGGQFNGRENGHVTGGQVEGEWSCYKDGQFNGGSMVMLLRWPINGGRMVILLRWPI